MVYSATACVVTCLIFLALAWLFIAVRSYVRIWLQHGPFLDDILALLGIAIYTTITTLFVIAEARRYFNASDVENSESPAIRAQRIKLFYVCDLLYMAGTYVMKISFAITLYRIAQTRAQLSIIWVVAITGTAMLVASEIHGLLFCRPISYLWERVVDPDTGGFCLEFWTRKVVEIVHASWVLTADISLGLIIPSLLLWNIPMHPKTKFSVRLLLGLGSMASIATIVRIPYLAAGQAVDQSANNVVVTFWGSIELGISIICTAAATWKPLVLKLGWISPPDRPLVIIQSPTLPSGEEPPSPRTWMKRGAAKLLHLSQSQNSSA